MDMETQEETSSLTGIGYKILKSVETISFMVETQFKEVNLLLVAHTTTKSLQVVALQEKLLLE